MKHFQQLILIFLVFTNGYLFAQNSSSSKDDYYEQGIKMYNANQFEKAQSFFKLALNTFKTVDPDSVYKLNMNSYYYLALTQFQLNDSCNACKNLMDCYGGYGYPEAIKLYDSLCFLKRKISYEKSFCPESKCYSSYEINVCTRLERHQNFYIDNLKTNNGCLFYFEDHDPNLERESHNTSFDITTIPSKKLIFNGPEEMPKFPGGDSLRIKFFFDNIKYPQDKKATDFQGKIYVSFIIEEDGSISNIKLLRGIETSLDDEVLRVINLMPKWNPGKCCGIPVRVPLNMPIAFSTK